MSKYAIAFGIITLVKLAYFKGTQFEKEIRVKNKYIRVGSGNHGYMINDTKGHIYRLGSSIWAWHWTPAELWNSLEQDQNYKVHGYGWRVSVLRLYPNVISIEDGSNIVNDETNNLLSRITGNTRN